MIENETMSLLLKEIARRFNPDIKEVSFSDLEDNKLGRVFKITTETYEYAIQIRNGIQCYRFLLFIFLHEVAHVVLYHQGYRRYTITPEQKENEADQWAFDKLKTLLTEDYLTVNANCISCMSTRSIICYSDKNKKSATYEGSYNSALVRLSSPMTIL